MSTGAAARGLEHAETGEAVAGVDRWRGAVPDPGDHRLVEAHVGAGLERYLLGAGGGDEPAGRGQSEARVARADALLELCLLRIEPVRGEARERAADAEARAVQRGHGAHPEVRALAVRMLQRDEHVVLHL